MKIFSELGFEIEFLIAGKENRLNFRFFFRFCGLLCFINFVEILKIERKHVQVQRIVWKIISKMIKNNRKSLTKFMGVPYQVFKRNLRAQSSRKVKLYYFSIQNEQTLLNDTTKLQNSDFSPPFLIRINTQKC